MLSQQAHDLNNTGEHAESTADPRSAAPPSGRVQPGTIALRLALAFVGVALAAVALLAGLAAAFASADVSDLAARQRVQVTNPIAVAAGAARDRTHTGDVADLSPAPQPASRCGAVYRCH